MAEETVRCEHYEDGDCDLADIENGCICCIECKPKMCFDPGDWNTPCRPHTDCPYTYHLPSQTWTRDGTVTEETRQEAQ